MQKSEVGVALQPVIGEPVLTVLGRDTAMAAMINTYVSFTSRLITAGHVPPEQHQISMDLLSFSRAADRWRHNQEPYQHQLPSVHARWHDVEPFNPFEWTTIADGGYVWFVRAGNGEVRYGKKGEEPTPITAQQIYELLVKHDMKQELPPSGKISVSLLEYRHFLLLSDWAKLPWYKRIFTRRPAYAPL